jgi:hypothetical protein
VPSFADPDRVWEDPLVRSRLISSAPPTQLDVQAQANQPAMPSENGDPDTWVLRFRNRDGQLTKRKMTSRQIVDGLLDNRIGIQVEAAKQPRGEFSPLSTYPEFRDVVAKRHTSAQSQARRDKSSDVANQPKVAPAASPTSRRALWIGVGIGLALVAIGVAWAVFSS